MAIESEDLNLFLEFRKNNFHGKKCAILGDCKIYNNNLESLCSLMGFEQIDTFDINGNPTFKVNLNEELPNIFFNKYDWIIDSGTLYCCFDTSTVLKNILYMLKDDGCIIHTSNLVGFFGRGFYSLSPALFRDFYKINNFDILCFATKTRINKNWVVNDYNNTYLSETSSQNEILFQEQSGNYVTLIPNDSLMLYFVKRKVRTDFKKPIPEHFIITNGK